MEIIPLKKILGKPHFTCDVHTGELRTSDAQAGFRKGRGTRGQIANICQMIEKARELQKKKSTSASLTTLTLLTV